MSWRLLPLWDSCYRAAGAIHSRERIVAAVARQFATTLRPAFGEKSKPLGVRDFSSSTPNVLKLDHNHACAWRVIRLSTQGIDAQNAYFNNCMTQF